MKNPPSNAGDAGSIPGWGRYPGEGNGTQLQYSCLGDLRDRGAWQATVHEVAKESDRTEQLNNSNNSLEKESFRTLSLLSQVNVTLSGTYDF